MPSPAISRVDKQVTWLVVTEVRSKSFGLDTEHRHYNARPIYALCSYVVQVLFSLSCGIMHFLCAMRVFKNSGIILTPGHLCAKFRFCGEICYSITHSIMQLTLCAGKNILALAMKAPLHTDYSIFLVNTISKSYCNIQKFWNLYLL